MKDLTLEDLLEFYQDDLHPETKEKVLTVLLQQPLYLQVLEAFPTIEAELTAEQSLRSFFKSKEKELSIKIFG